MGTLIRLALPWVITILIIAAIAMAIGIGNQLGHGLSEYHLP